MWLKSNSYQFKTGCYKSKVFSVIAMVATKNVQKTDMHNGNKSMSRQKNQLNKHKGSNR